MLEYGGIQITWLGHDGFKFKKDGVIYIDPFKLGTKPEAAELVCVTHEHFDHLSVDDLKKLVTPKTTVVTIAACQDAVKALRPKALRLVRPGDRLDVDHRPAALDRPCPDRFRAASRPERPPPTRSRSLLSTSSTARSSTTSACSPRKRQWGALAAHAGWRSRICCPT